MYISLFLTELKYRSLYLLLSYFLTLFIISYYYEELLFLFLNSLLEKSLLDQLVTTSIEEAFITYSQLIFLFSCIIICPFILIQSILFLTPGLYRYERMKLWSTSIKLVCMIVLGFLFTIHILIPSFYSYFMSYNSSFLLLEIRIYDYLKLTIEIFLGILIFLLIPFSISLMNLDSKFLILFRKYIFLLLLIISGFITPPDYISQFFLTILFYSLYEIIILSSISTELWNKMNKSIGN